MRAHQQISEDLVQYALGELNPPQSGEIREHLDDCSTCSRELEEIHTGMAALAMSASASAPPARSRVRLLKAVAAEPHAQAVVMRRPWWNLVPAFASVVLAIIGLLLWRENSSLRNRVEALRTEVQNQQQSAAKAEAVLQTLTAPDAAQFTLVAANTKPQPQGRAIYLRNDADFAVARGLLAAEIDRPTSADFGGDLRLLGYNLGRDELRPGSGTDLTLHWQAPTPSDGRFWAPMSTSSSSRTTK